MHNNNNGKFLGHHDTLIRDTKPSSKIWNALTDVYWSLTLSQLTAHDGANNYRKHVLGRDSDKPDIEYSATFRVEGSRIRATITPKMSGHYLTHLTKWQWFALLPKLKGEEVKEVA